MSRPASGKTSAPRAAADTLQRALVAPLDANVLGMARWRSRIQRALRPRADLTHLATVVADRVEGPDPEEALELLRRLRLVCDDAIRASTGGRRAS